MGKLREIKGYVRVTLDKLPGIRTDLVRLGDEWSLRFLKCWRYFVSGVTGIRYTHPTSLLSRETDSSTRGRKTGNRDHVSSVVQLNTSLWTVGKVVSVAEGKKHLSEKRLCFNCTDTRHRAAECRITRSFQKCNGRHHASICDKEHPQLLLTTYEDAVIYPVVVVNVDGIKCRALLDTGAGSAYASAVLIKHLGKQPSRTEHKRIDMMMCSATQKKERPVNRLQN